MGTEIHGSKHERSRQHYLHTIFFIVVAMLFDRLTAPYAIYTVDYLNVIHISSLHAEEETSPLGDPIVLVVVTAYDVIVYAASVKIISVLQRRNAIILYILFPLYFIILWMFRINVNL